MKSMMSIVSPYQMNPMNVNPLRDVLEQQVNFEELERSQKTKLFYLCDETCVPARVKIFHTPAVTPASFWHQPACRRFSGRRNQWRALLDGRLHGQPRALPAVLLHRIARRGILPSTRSNGRPADDSADIANRLNEITFNSSLIKELRSVYFVQKRSTTAGSRKSSGKS